MDATELRARLVATLTDDPRHSWTCTADRLIVRRTGRTLCKIGIFEGWLFVDMIPPPSLPPSPLFSDAPPPDAQGSAWRRALVRTSEELEQIMTWLA